jgi:hypothetical protein
MNTPNDIRWLLFATVPVHGYINLATPISRGIVWLWRRVFGSRQHRHPEITEECGESLVAPAALMDQPVP